MARVWRPGASPAGWSAAADVRPAPDPGRRARPGTARHVTAIEGGRAPGWSATSTPRWSGPAGRCPGRPESEGPFDAVALALPPDQAAPLVAPHAPAWPRCLETVRLAPCWTLMAAFAAPLPLAGRAAAGG